MKTTAISIFFFFLAIVVVVGALDIEKARKRKNVKYKFYTSVSAYLLLLPACIMAFLFVLLPILYSLGYSFTNYYSLEPESTKIIWFDNFKEILHEFKNERTDAAKKQLLRLYKLVDAMITQRF